MERMEVTFILKLLIIIIIILLTHEKPNKAYESYTHSQVQTMNRVKQLYA